ncbi:RICIN domain-containing protein [Asanoa ishikariensis]|uniref:RICIN domain-containing protein n=1 Tax=Asanoa ishikariensis TaxID=137265 RepID=UPI0023B20D56|nr:RICIN domain-containing protein [Asanoa ishikariensis]
MVTWAPTPWSQSPALDERRAPRSSALSRPIGKPSNEPEQIRTNSNSDAVGIASGRGRFALATLCLSRNQHSQKCIRVPRNSTVAGAPLEQYTCQEANRSNLWVPMTTARGGSPRLYKNVNSGLCMGIASAGTANGTRLIQWTCNRSSASQIFYAGA